MRVRDFRCIPFRLPLRRAWRSAAGRIGERSGWLLAIETDDGLAGWGECSSDEASESALPRLGLTAEPAPEGPSQSWGGPAMDLRRLTACAEALLGVEVVDALERVERMAFPRPGLAAQSALQGPGQPWDGPALDLSFSPALHCALETALLDVLARRDGVPLARWLNPAAAMAVRVNAALGELDDEVGRRAARALAEGCTLFKLKLGVHPWDVERGRLAALAHSLPANARLRLDANRAWSEAEASAILEELRDLPVEALEEPLREPDLASLARLQSALPFALALDESLGALGFERVLAHAPVRRLVLKPMRVGGPRRLLAMARRAERAGMECVVTTTVDSAVGTLCAAHAAAALGNDLAHGLATSAWLARDVAAPPRIAHGKMQLSGAGLGVTPRAEKETS